MNTQQKQPTNPLNPPERPEEAREWFHNRRRGMLARRPHLAMILRPKAGQ